MACGIVRPCGPQAGAPYGVRRGGGAPAQLRVDVRCDMMPSVRENQAWLHTQHHAHDPRIREIMCVKV